MSRPTIPLFKVFLSPRDELMPALEEQLYSGFISEGQPVVNFEEDFAKTFDIPVGISLYCCTAALHVALILADVQQGDEVISTAVTTEPTNMAILQTGATIKWADVDSSTGNISAESIRDAITEKTKAIMLVHFGGVPASINAIREVAEEAQIPVIEDAAHALGAKYAGQPIGNHSEFVAFSFQAIKHMTTVDGGMLICRDNEKKEKGRKIRWFGIDRNIPRSEAEITDVGYKYHMNNVTAAIGSVQLKHVGPLLDRHKNNGQFFDQNLGGIDGLSLSTRDELAEPSYWAYTVLVDRKKDFISYMSGKGIAAGEIIKRNDYHPIFKERSSYREGATLVGVDKFISRMVQIPCGWWVSDEDREYIAETIKQGW